MKHLVSMKHDVSRATETWCEQWEGGVTENVAEADCDDCLMSVLDLAEEVRERRAELLAAKAPPACECRAGAHPARENYMKGAAERDGAVCKLGWPL